MRSKKIGGLIAMAVIVAAVVMSAGCVEKGQVNQGELTGKILASVGQIDTYRFDMDLNATQRTLLRNATEATEMITVSTGNAVVDVINKTMKMNMTTRAEMSNKTEMPKPVEMKTEVYLLNNTMYMKMDRGIPGMPGQWTKREMPVGYDKYWESQNQVDQQMALLNISEVERLADEKVHGMDCYVLKIKPNMEKYVALLMQQEGKSEFMQNLGENASFKLGKMIKAISIKQWIAKDTLYPLKTEMQERMEMNSTDLNIPGQEFTTTSDQRTTMSFYDYNKPMTIELPEAAGRAATAPLFPAMNATTAA